MFFRPLFATERNNQRAAHPFFRPRIFGFAEALHGHPQMRPDLGLHRAHGLAVRRGPQRRQDAPALQDQRGHRGHRGTTGEAQHRREKPWENEGKSDDFR